MILFWLKAVFGTGIKRKKKFEMLVPITFSRLDIKQLMEKQLSEHSDYIDINKLIETKINN